MRIAALMGRSNADFENALFTTYIDVDLKNPDVYAVYLNQSGLGLPDRDYYLKADFAAKKQAYEAHAQKLLTLIGWKDAAANAKAIVALETKIADASWTKAEQRDLDKIYNPMTVAELSAFAPGFDWKGFLNAAGLGAADRVIVAENTAFPKLAAIFAATDLNTLKAWVAYHTADNASPYLSKAFADAWFDLHAKKLGGQKEQKVRWKRGVQAVAGGDFLTGERIYYFGNMGWGVGELYTAKYFPPSAKAKIEDLVQNLKAAYRVRIQKLDWMGAATKKASAREARHLHHQGRLSRHACARLFLARHSGRRCARQCAALRRSSNGRITPASSDGPVDKSEWFMTPQTNDAYNGSLCATSCFRPASCRRRSSMPMPTPPTITARWAA